MDPELRLKIDQLRTRYPFASYQWIYNKALALLERKASRKRLAFPPSEPSFRVDYTYANIGPSDFWVFAGPGAKRASLSRCKVKNVCVDVIDNIAVFVEPPDAEAHHLRFFLSVIGDFSVNPNLPLSLTGA